MLQRIFAALQSGNQQFSCKLQTGLPTLSRIWLTFALIVSAARGISSAAHASSIHMFLLFGVLAVPVLALHLVLNHFRRDTLVSQPAIRLARLGHWRELSALDCMAFQYYGAAGLVSMLLAGLLLNIPVRVFEFLTAMPTPLLHAPAWYLPLYGLMLADLALLSSCYAALVGLAMRRVPYFPRLLVMTWFLDVGAQLAIGGIMNIVPNVPHTVHTSLASLLGGNMQKVFISMAIWIPYLLMSPRVNLTYRNRIAAMPAYRPSRRTPNAHGLSNQV
jgi:hypothetical protein